MHPKTFLEVVRRHPRYREGPPTSGLYNAPTPMVIRPTKNFLLKHISKKLVCTNPDLIVHRGNKEEYCAGYIAKIFKELGGDVIYYGKPYKAIYEMCFKSNEKVLAIGDNLRTDIKGANNLNKDCLFISNGVHRKEFSNNLELQKLLDKYKVKANYFQKELQW